MKLIETLVDLIVEAAPEEIYKKYYSDIDRPEFIRIISLDPTSKTNGEDIQRIGKYAKLLLKMFKEGNLKTEDFPKAKDYLSLVYKHQVPVDMVKVKTLGDLFSLVEKYYSSDDNQSVFDLINVLDSNEYELLLSGDKWIIYRPKSEKAASYLGTGTQWCTAWGPYSTNKEYRGRQNHFSHHNNQGWLYVIINRERPEEKYQFHFETKQFMDRYDRKIDSGDFFQRKSEVTRYFFPSLFDDTELDKDQIDIMDSLNSSLRAKLIERLVGETDNQLVNYLINLEGDDLIEELKSTYITDPNLKELKFDYLNREIGSPTLSFEIDITDSNELLVVHDTLKEYERGFGYGSDHSDWLTSEINDTDEDYQRELLEPILKEYFEKHVTYTDNYEQWNEYMIDHYFESLIKEYANEYGYLNDPLYETAHEVEANKIKKYIILDEETIDVNPHMMALFVHREKLTRLDDVLSFFGAYVEHHGLVYDYENPYFEQAPEYPKLHEMKAHLEKYDEDVEEIFETRETENECAEGLERFKDIKNKFFKDSRSFYSDDIRVHLLSGYNCNSKTVKVKIDYTVKNGENSTLWKRWDGTMDLDRLVEYMTNKRLFENLH